MPDTNSFNNWDQFDGRSNLLPGQKPSYRLPPGEEIDSEIDEMSNLKNEALLSILKPEVSMLHRAVLSLIKDEPKLGVDYLRRKGYDAHIDDDDNLVYKNPKGTWSLVNPNGLDVGDVIDVIPDLLEATASALASGAKVAGILGTPATGGSSFVAGSLLGGIATGGVEAAKQKLAKSLGARETFNEEEILNKAALGTAVPLGLGAAWKGLSKGAQGLSKLIFKGTARQPIDVEGIKAAGNMIGAKPTPGMLSDEPALRATESVLSKQTLGIGGMGLRHQLRVNEKAAIDTAEALVSGRTAKSAFEVGEAFAEKLKNSIAARIKPAEDIYDSIQGILKEVPANLTGLKTEIINIKKILGLSDEAMAVVSKMEKKFDKIKNVADLKNFRTIIMDEIPVTASKNAKIVADRIYRAATEARHQSFVDAVKNPILARKGDALFQKESLLKQLEKADGIYKDTISLVQKAILSQGKNVQKGLKREVDEVLAKTVPEKRLDRFFPKQDTARMRALKELSPDGFSELAQARISDIAKRATQTGKGTFGMINPRAVASQIESMSPEIAKEVFGESGLLKAKAMAKFYRAIPGDLNPSGTANVADLIMSPFRIMTSVPLQAINLFLRSKEPTAKTALFMILNEAMKPLNREDLE